MNMDAEQKERFDNICEYLFDQGNMVNFIQNKKTHEYNPDGVVRAEFHKSMEVGSDQNKYHCHGIVRLKHTRDCYITMNFALIKDWLRQSFGDVVYFNAKVMKDNDAELTDYIQKQ